MSEDNLQFNQPYDSDRPLAAQVAERLKQLIVDKHMESGDKLPTEKRLAEIFGVARSTVREAIKTLVSQNILRVRQGSGTYVADLPGLAADPLGFTFVQNKRKLNHDLLEVRGIIEPEVAAMAAVNASEEQIAHLESLYYEMEKLILAGEDYVDVDIEFHKTISEASGNMVVPRLTPLINEAVDLFTHGTGYQLLQETLDTHKGVMVAIKEHNALAARDAMTLHLAYNRNALQEIERAQMGLPRFTPQISDALKKKFNGK